MSKFDFSQLNRPLRKEDSELFNPDVARRKQRDKELASLHNPDQFPEPMFTSTPKESAAKRVRSKRKPTAVVKPTPIKKLPRITANNRKSQTVLLAEVQEVECEDDVQETRDPTNPWKAESDFEEDEPLNLDGDEQSEQAVIHEIQPKQPGLTSDVKGAMLKEQFSPDKLEAGLIVLCESNGFYYKAKIVDIVNVETLKTRLLHFHYDGWNKRYDEKIREEDALKRFKEFTSENYKNAQAEIASASGKITKTVKVPTSKGNVAQKNKPLVSSGTRMKKETSNKMAKKK